jgi:MFS family permease
MNRLSKQVLSLSIARACQSFAVSFIIIILPVFISSGTISTEIVGYRLFGFNITEEFIIGVAISIAALTSSLGQPIGGRLTDTYKKRKIFIISGLLLICASFPFYLVIDSYWGIIVLRIVDGVSGAIIIPAASALVNEEAVNKDRGENFGIYNSLRLIGFGLGPVVAGSIISRNNYNIIYQVTGIELAFMVAVLFSVFSLIIVILFVDESGDKSINSESRMSINDVIKSDMFKPILVLGFSSLLLAASISVFVTLEDAVNKRLGQTAFMFSIQFSATILSNTVSQPLIGRISDNRGRKNLIFLGFLLLIPTITIQGFVNTTLAMTLLRIAQGISTALVFAPALALTGDISDKTNAGTFLSIVTASFGLGIAIGPTLSGFLYSIGSFTTPFIASGILSFFGLLMVYYYVPDR